MRKPYKILAFFLIIFLTGCVPKSYHIGNTNAGFSAADSVPFLPPLQSREAVPFGAKRGGATLDGIIFYAREGEPVVAARSGRVVFVGEGLTGYAKTVILEHSEDFSTVYARNLEIFVKSGQQIHQGELIGKITGAENKGIPSLYFEIRKKNQAEDPKLYLPGAGASHSV